MTLVELQKKLGEQIAILTDEREPMENKTRVANVALVVSSLAKQMINNADVILRVAKLPTETKLQTPEVLKMVNGGYALLEKGPEGELSVKEL